MSMEFHPNPGLRSWGRVGTRLHQVARPRFIEDVRQWNRRETASRLPVGKLRSYSDVCLCDGGNLVDMTGLNRFRSFDPESGILVAEAGVTIDELLTRLVPLGFFVPVTPGTRSVTLGGAVANDVHGKNHHRSGTFGRHVQGLVLERSDEGSLRIGPDERVDLFRATIGGLGLTGIISEVAIRLQRISSSRLWVETVPAYCLDELCEQIELADSGFEHVVAWIDCTASGPQLGRGIVTRANWAGDGILEPHRERQRSMPTDRLGALLNPLTLKGFNMLYHAKGTWSAGSRLSHYDGFLYPLDSISHWNRLYGRKGFYQYQCVIPAVAGREPVRALLAEISASGEGSFLAVLKRFGPHAGAGMLSFPMPGLTLALDFANRGQRTLDIFERLDRIVEECGGRLYAAKDLRLPPEIFRRSCPEFDDFRRFVDPRSNSEFWTRLNS